MSWFGACAIHIERQLARDFSRYIRARSTEFCARAFLRR
jgi:hypothetical protein